MNWEIIGTIVMLGIALYALVALIRFFENNSSNWRRLGHIEQMLQELTKKDVDKDESKN